MDINQSTPQNKSKHLHTPVGHAALLIIVLAVCALLAYVFFVSPTNAPTGDEASTMESEEGGAGSDQEKTVEGGGVVESTQSPTPTSGQSSPGTQEISAQEASQLEADLRAIPPPPPPPAPM